ncbi:MAG: STM4012 family radical SAM protein [Isosphaeraceae bacterium]
MSPTTIPPDARTPLDDSPYQGYLYSYPHKTSYRPLDPPVALGPLWEAERRDALFLYVHIPFCGMRCGFCNLFTRAGASEDAVARYLAALTRQARRVREALGDARFARFALGGGTPTYLDARSLDTVLDLAERVMGADLRAVPASVEVSPETVDAEKLNSLVTRGVDRISIGVETFDDAEASAVFRPQSVATVEKALDLIREAGPSILNVDLIYGLPGQSVASWVRSVDRALRRRPEELYLYPLYVRPLTGLERSGKSWDDLRLACHREGRDLLISEGYEQVSMRMFRRIDAVEEAGPTYSCQDDGMVGLGCGARSYTQDLHYATEYAVAAKGVRAILDDYASRPDVRFDFADYGRRLGPEDQRRRFVLQGLLTCEGLNLASYEARFGASALDDLPELTTLVHLGLADLTAGVLRLSERGLERSDAVGPWLISEAVRQASEDYSWR